MRTGGAAGCVTGRAGAGADRGYGPFARHQRAGLATLGRVRSAPAYKNRVSRTASPGKPARRAPAHRKPNSHPVRAALARMIGGKFWLLVHELGKFGIVGVIAVLIADVGSNLLHFQAGVGPLAANVIATIVATTVSWAGNRYWTFRHRQRTGVVREGLMFFLLNGVGLGIQLACLGFTTYVLGRHDTLSYNVALVIGIGLATLFRYWAYRTWVWRAPPARQDAARPEAPQAPRDAAARQVARAPWEMAGLEAPQAPWDVVLGEVAPIPHD